MHEQIMTLYETHPQYMWQQKALPEYVQQKEPVEQQQQHALQQQHRRRERFPESVLGLLSDEQHEGAYFLGKGQGATMPCYV